MGKQIILYSSQAAEQRHAQQKRRQQVNPDAIKDIQAAALAEDDILMDADDTNNNFTPKLGTNKGSRSAALRYRS
jgi:hypothetical protein